MWLRWLCALLLLAASPALAQNNQTTRTLRIAHIEADIRVDGQLQESVWSQIEPATDFIQTEPNEGAPASERTEVFIFYNNEKLYFGFKCYDSEPDKIIAHLDAHDVFPQSDNVGIFLDSFGDRRTGYSFVTNSRGVQFDALVSEIAGTRSNMGGGSSAGAGSADARFDSSWDGIWESAARIQDWGWAAEVAIPFKSIRFTPGQPWGLNLRREIVRKNERAYWQFVTRFDTFVRPSRAGILEGIENVEPSRNLEIVPYFSSRIRRGATDPQDKSEKYDAGADVRWGILPNATVNLTINPDFADTEADEINITISRFELFFPEKRAFFNEGSNFYSTPLNLFFTRRVGARLPDGLPQRILLGAKATGKLAGWSLGAIEARTQQTHFTDPDTGDSRISPGANFFVLRLQRDIWSNSTIGLLTVNRDQGAGDIGSTQRVHALDLGVVAGAHLRWSNQIAYNQNETTAWGGVHRIGVHSQVFYDTDRWNAGTGYKYLGRGFDVSGIGFEPETDRHRAFAFARYKPFIGRYALRQIFFELNQDISLDTTGLLQDSGSDADLKFEFKNFWSVRARYSYDRIRFNQFTPDFQRLPEMRVYIEPRIRLFLTTNENRPVFLSYTFTARKLTQFRDNFYGQEQRHELSLNARLLGRTRVEFRGTWVREFLLDGTPFQMRRLFITRLNHQLTRKLRTRVLGQVSNDRLGQNFNLNSIVAYDFTARSAAIVGYNYQRRSPGERSDLGNEFFVKFSYLFHF